MRKYNYFVDDIQVKRNDFFKQLKDCSQTSRRIDTINGWFGVDIMEFNEEQYKRYMRVISTGIGIIIVNGNLSKKFQRKVI